MNTHPSPHSSSPSHTHPGDDGPMSKSLSSQQILAMEAALTRSKKETLCVPMSYWPHGIKRAED